jgi:hypothetical protein
MPNPTLASASTDVSIGISATQVASYSGVGLSRAGGGGSSSGGSSGGGSYSSSSHSSYSSHSYSSSSGTGDSLMTLIITVVFISIVVVFAFVGSKKQAARRRETDVAIDKAAAEDPAWSASALKQRVDEVFYGFQKAWCDLDLEAMKNLLTENYFKRMVLELGALKNLRRRNVMEDLILGQALVVGVIDEKDDAIDSFTVQIRATAKDTLLDTAADKPLFVDTRWFTEYWVFKREAGQWKLDLIKQSTEERSLVEPRIADFAARHGFYFDPDFGWLMMPNAGAIFRRTNFGLSDINNHVVGYYRDKIVEFYTYIPRTDAHPLFKKNYVVAQAILPINYRDILIRKRSWFLNPAPRGLRPISLESPDFNRKFFVCADPQDSVSSLELLTPNFMERIHGLPFNLNIEIVGNVLYFYTLDRRASYDQMLEIISWAFDEMRI